MERDKFQEAVHLNNQMSYLQKIKSVTDGGLLELRDSTGRSVTISYDLIKKINELFDKEISEVDQKIKNL